MKRAVRLLAIAMVGLAGVAAVLYLFGGRIVLDGSGRLQLAFVESSETRAQRVERHRAAQRAETAGGEAAVTLSPDDRTIAAAAAAAEPAASPPPPAAHAPPPPYWTDLRGPTRDGHYRERPVLTDWPAGGLEPMWKQPVGEGYASFVVAGGRAFTIEQRGAQEVVAAYDVRTGHELWTTSWAAAFRERMGGDGPRATPTWADGFVYALGALGELRRLEEATGRVIWRTNILADAGASNLQWGMAASPLIVDETVVVLPGGPRGNSVVAYDRRTGVRAWSALDDRQAYASPVLATLAGTRQILVVSASRLMGLSPTDGALLWDYPWRTQYDINAAQPIVIGNDRVFISSGYGKGAAVIEVSRHGAAAPGTATDETPFSVREVWRNIRMKNRFSSSILHDGYLYGLDEGILACVDAETGELQWKAGRYGHGQLVLASSRLIVLAEDGDLVLVRPTPERHDEQVRFSAIEGKTWNHLALADGILLIRNLREMAAFDLTRE
jgi:outer membrane protein assembly factor BamB